MFEQLMMLFDFKNKSSMFQHYINNKFHDFLDIFVIVYIDDILIYSSMLSEHWKHVQIILEWLWKVSLQCNIKKCKFHAIEVTYLDLIIICNDIKMNSAKIEAIVSWESSQNIHDVWAFLRFVNFYWWFIKYFSKIV